MDTDDIFSTPPPCAPVERQGHGTLVFLTFALLPLIGSRLVDPARIGSSLIDLVLGGGLVAFVVVTEVARRRRREDLAVDAQPFDQPVQGGARVRPGLARLRGAGDNERGLSARTEQKVGQRVRGLVVDL
jgi:hypothetical protein